MPQGNYLIPGTGLLVSGNPAAGGGSTWDRSIVLHGK